jgi:cob(I)alamin adenosyltransferase
MPIPFLDVFNSEVPGAAPSITSSDGSPAAAIQGSRLAARSCERAAVSLGCSGDRFSSVLGDLLYDLARRAVIALPGDIGLRNHSDERLALDDG